MIEWRRYYRYPERDSQISRASLRERALTRFAKGRAKEELLSGRE